MSKLNWKSACLIGLLLAPCAPLIASERAETAWTMVESGALLIDVRTAEEFASGHLEQAGNIPLSEVATGFRSIDKSQPIVVYCRSGNRSSIAMQALIKQGFTNVHNGGGLSEMQQTQLEMPPLN